MQAQSVTVKTDRTQILIGERIEYELTLNLPAEGYRVNVRVSDSVSHFDIVENRNFDTVSRNGSIALSKKIIFTSFDSGLWRIPSFEVLLEKNTVRNTLYTDSILVNVGYAPADSSNQLRDIKPVMEVTITDDTWIYITATILLVIIVVLLLYFYFKKRKKKPAPVFHAALSPYEEAMKALQNLKQHELDKPDQVKQYYVSLAEIFKRYYSRKQSKDLMSNTTGDILLEIKDQQDDPPLLSAVAEALRCADAVKFAKYVPNISESGKNQQQLREAIEKIEKNSSHQKQ